MSESTRTYSVQMSDVIDLDGAVTRRLGRSRLREVLIENLLDKWTGMSLRDLAEHLVDKVTLIEERPE